MKLTTDDPLISITKDVTNLGNFNEEKAFDLYSDLKNKAILDIESKVIFINDARTDKSFDKYKDLSLVIKREYFKVIFSDGIEHYYGSQKSALVALLIDYIKSKKVEIERDSTESYKFVPTDGKIPAREIRTKKELERLLGEINA